MLKYTFKRLLRSPLSAIGVTLFAIIISFVLCRLYASNVQEVADFQRVYNSIPVTMTVTNLTGNRTDMLDLPTWVSELFTSDSMKSYVTDIRTVMRHDVNDTCDFFGYQLIGSTHMDLIDQLTASKGGSVNFLEGYDESIFASEELYCIIPEGTEYLISPDGTVNLRFACADYQVNSEQPVYHKADLDFTVVGTYPVTKDSLAIYCPFWAAEKVQYRTGCETTLDKFSATLADNEKLEDFREIAAKWFTQPNPKGEKTPCKFLSYKFYPYAMKIDDYLLRRASATLQTSIAINKFSTMMVFILSAGAAFFIGFLVIRSRKREIILLRTLGTGNSAIYLGFAAEQFLSILLGTAMGGWYYAYQPPERLSAFVLIYFVGLSAALWLFLRSNLLSTQKEEN